MGIEHQKKTIKDVVENLKKSLSPSPHINEEAMMGMSFSEEQDSHTLESMLRDVESSPVERALITMVFQQKRELSGISASREELVRQNGKMRNQLVQIIEVLDRFVVKGEGVEGEHEE